MNSSHPSRLVHVGKASFGKFAAYLLQPLAPIPSDSPPVLVRSLPLLLFAIPVAPAAGGVGDLGPYPFVMKICQNRAAVIPLVSHQLFHSVCTDPTHRRLRFRQCLL